MNFKLIGILIIAIIIFISPGCIENNNHEDINYFDAISLHNIANIDVYGPYAIIRENVNINEGDKLILRDIIHDIHIVNKSNAEQYIGIEENKTALCFNDIYINMYFDDPLAGAYVGKGFAIFVDLIQQYIKINDTIEITFYVEYKSVSNKSNLIINFNVQEESIKIIQK